ncbi:enoyl-CoA hydratase/isomerase family protein [Streptomonospora salina]|uniref:enoyl-CoA hydratase n=1 Tax=Streptomonospora salina TaxID=104205 RepID=A0A841E407_9ACTN|nr:enoyl-CoA hydratase-related protein [Streptomonospora salina]MBB5997462.1 enoyl-CoA hydratase/carnithine racemase [Streptomonospora salina]
MTTLDEGTGGSVRVERDAEHPAVAVLRLDRPKMNALDARMQREIRAAAERVGADDDVRAVVVYGGERVFAAGADVTEMAEMGFAEISDHARGLQEAMTAVAGIPKPVIAAITGFALGGGCELALCADFRVAAEDARLGQPEIRLGVIPGAGGTQRLARLVGPSRAKDLIYTGRHAAAEEALSIGLVDAVVAPSEVYDRAIAMAASYAGGPALALRAAKQAIDGGLETDLATGLEIERMHFAGLFATEDQKAGMRSFVEEGPGKARFSGR